MQESMKYADAAKVGANAKADAPEASNASNAYKINTPNINVNRGMVKPCAVSIALSRRMSLRQQALRDTQSYGEVADTGKFDATIDAKKEAKKEVTKSEMKLKSDAISTSRCVTLINMALFETQNYGLDGGDYSDKVREEKK